MRLLIATSMACVSISALGQAQRPELTPDQVASIDAFVTQEMQREHIPGVAVGVYSRGKILLTKGYGLANIELNVPVKPETIFQSGSVGKQFVSAAIMMLAEEDKLSIDDSVTKYFPDAPASWRPILLKNLLSHTSGLSEYESEEYTKPGGPFNMRLDYSEDELVKKIEALPIENSPGDKWNYRNTNYFLLGVLIHRITGMPYAEFLAQRIFKPLGMSSTRLISESDIIPNRASGYEIHDGQLKNQEWVSPTFNSTADGTLYFNVLDLAKWDEALYTTRLLKQSSLDRMWTVYPLNDGKPNPDGYGFGWEIKQQNGHKLIEHGGAWQGFSCRISRYPDDSLTVVVLTNLEAGHARPGIFASIIAGLAYPPLMPKKLAPIDDTQPALIPILRTLLDRLTAGEDIRDQMSSNLSAQMSPDRMKSIRKALSLLWPGGVLTLVKRDLKNGSPLSVYRLTKPDGDTRLIYFTQALDGKIEEFAILQNRDYQ